METKTVISVESVRGVFDGYLFFFMSSSVGLDTSQSVVSIYKARGVKPLEVVERQENRGCEYSRVVL